MTYEELKNYYEGMNERTILIINSVDIHHINQRLQESAVTLHEHAEAISALEKTTVTREQCEAHHSALMKNFMWVAGGIMGAATIAATLLAALIKARF